MEKQFIEEVFRIIYGDIIYKNKSYDDALEKLRNMKYGDQLYEDILNFLKDNKFNLFSLPTQKQIEQCKKGAGLLKKIKSNGGMTRTIRNYHLYLDRKYNFSKLFNEEVTQEVN